MPPSRYSLVDRHKADGATYTPPALAAFVADQIVRAANLPASGPIRLLDPAVGDGALLASLIARLPASVRQRVQAFGFDTDPAAIHLARARLGLDFPEIAIKLETGDFLDYLQSCERICDGGQGAQFAQFAQFDLVIANPPYVRTQIMGAQQAQELAQRFGLSGRVDLYYPFLLGISMVLATDGVAGVITSNRFMTTKSGQAVRRALLSRFALLHVWDLGDTKLFDAAVLPAVMLARLAGTGLHEVNVKDIACSSIYSSSESAQEHRADPLAALMCEDNRVVAMGDGRKFHVRHGRLENGGSPDGVWRVGTGADDAWLGTVTANTWANFSRIGKIRVGVKSTADKVFIRADWDDLPGGAPELLRPLITRHCARRFRAVELATPGQQILYPHEAGNPVTGQGRAAVDLALYPKARRYLETQRHILEQRDYLIKAGRQWYELWVPQDPAAWAFVKLVFRDIAAEPQFWIDTGGGVVNGECYWLRAENDAPEDLLWLALAVANSSFIAAFYDKRFNNKLYGGRRRFMAQYVEQFPLPDPARPDVQAMVLLVKAIYAQTPSEAATRMAQDLDAMVWRVFGLLAREAGASFSA